MEGPIPTVIFAERRPNPIGRKKMDVSSSPVKRDTDIKLQDFRSPSKKRNMEDNCSNRNILNLREYPRSSKESDLLVGDLTDSAKQIKEDLSENSPSNKRDLEDDRDEKVLEQQTRLSQCLESPSKKQKRDSQLAEERHFYRLFQNVLDGIAEQCDLSEEEVENGIETIKTSFYYDLGNQFSDVDLSDADNICGYLFRLATLDAGLVRYRCLQAIQNCSILERMLRKTKLRVVSLGGGPGNDIVGFLSALHEVRQPRGCKLELSVVDAVYAWKDCVNLVKNLIQNNDFGSVSEICKQNRVNISFHETILPCNHEDNCYKALRKADIILISRFISIVGWTEKREIMKNVYNLIQDASLVLFIDVPFYEDMLEYFESLYRSGEDQYELCKTNRRFNQWESGSSMAGITVLRKIID